MRGSWRTLLVRSFVAAIAALALACGPALAAKFKVLHSFGTVHNDGSNPEGGLVMDAAGNLYGTAAAGGRGAGTAFELEAKGSGKFKFKTIYRFCESSNFCGMYPNGPLIIDTSGNLYGTANDVVFELSPQADKKSWSEKILYPFCLQQNCVDGEFAQGGLTYAGASSGVPYDGVSPLYGVTAAGGANNGGAVFQLANNDGSWSESVLYNFCSLGGDKCLDGTEPAAGVILDSAGNLYGTTKFGGGNNVGKGHAGAGIVYELEPNGSGGWQQTVLYRFCGLSDCSDGAVPFAPVLMDSEGNLLGTTGFGGRQCSFSKESGCGTIFKLVPNGESSQETVLYAFCAKKDCRDGLTPDAGLLLDEDGNLFGTTEFGGGNDSQAYVQGAGTVFKLTDEGLQTLHSFCSNEDCTDGAEPNAQLIMDGTGRLYGTASLGGDFEEGTLFETAP